MNKKIVGVTTFIILILNTVISYGVLNSNVTITSNKQKVAPGEEITITLRASDITGSEPGVSGIETVLKYDKNVFEQVKENDISSSWTISYVESQEYLTAETINSVTSNTNILTLKLKLKANASEGSTKIEFSNSEIYNLEESVEVTITPINITVEKKSETVINETEKETNKNTTTNNTKVESDNTAKKVLPNAGKEETMIGVGAGTLAIIGIVGGIRFIRRR